MSACHLLVVTGASGAGKTATVRALESRGIPGVRCFHCDSIGVPTEDVMVRDHGGDKAGLPPMSRETALWRLAYSGAETVGPTWKPILTMERWCRS